MLRPAVREEARALAGVADVAVAEPLHLHQHRVVVAVDEHARRPARRLPDVSPFIHSLLRVRLKKVAKPVLRGQRERFFVHEADHQHFGALRVLNDRRNQAVNFEKSINLP